MVFYLLQMILLPTFLLCVANCEDLFKSWKSVLNPVHLEVSTATKTEHNKWITKCSYPRSTSKSLPRE